MTSRSKGEGVPTFVTICDVGGKGVKPCVTSHVRKFTAGASSFASFPYRQ